MNLKRLWATEPARIIALVLTVMNAVVVPEAWAKVVVAVLTLLAGEGIRSQVYAPATVDELTAPPGTGGS
jgi:hypothetical protein